MSLLMLGSVAVTFSMFLFTARSAKKKTRIRPRLDIARLIVTAGVVIYMGRVVHVSTPLIAIVGAIALGFGMGFVQGRNLDITVADGKAFATRTLIGVTVWLGGLVAMQVAGFVNRTGVFRIGQMISLFGAFTALGLFFGRRAPIERAHTGRPAVIGSATLLLAIALGASLFTGSSAMAQTAVGRDDGLCDVVLTGSQMASDYGFNLDPWSLEVRGIDFDGSFNDAWAYAHDASTPAAGCIYYGKYPAGYVDDLRIGLIEFDSHGTAESDLNVIVSALGAIGYPIRVGAATAAGEEFGSDLVEIETPQTTFWLVVVGPYLLSADTYLYETVYTADGSSTRREVLDDARDAMVQELRSASAAVLATGTENADPTPSSPDTTADTSSIPSGPTESDMSEPVVVATPSDNEGGGILPSWLTGGNIDSEDAVSAATAAVAAAVAAGLMTMAEGQQVLGDLLDGISGEAPGGGVVDEYGDVLEPREDGLYPWDDGDRVRWVPRSELDELIARGRGAQIGSLVDEAERLSRNRAQAEADWGRFRTDFRSRMASTRAREALERAAGEAAFTRGVRLRDVLERNAGDPVYDAMLDRLERDPAPSDEDFWTMRDVMTQQTADQAAIDALGDASVTRMTLEGMHDDIAWAAGKVGTAVGGPTTGQLVEWVVRNPEMPVRIAIAYGTSGASEVILAPFDVWRTLEQAADDKMAAQNRDLTAGEITWEVGTAVVTEWLTGKIGRAMGGSSGAAEEALPRINRMRRTHMPEAMPPAPNLALRRLDPGDAIPTRLIPQTGFTRSHIRELGEFTAEHNVRAGARTTNPYSLSPLRAGEAIPKPLGVKAKTIGDIDVHLGAERGHRGTVGLFEPKMPDTSGMTDELADAVRTRFAQRTKEWDKLADALPQGRNAALESGSATYRQGGRVFDTATGKPFAGDMDLVYLKDARTGEPITGQRYRDLVEEMERRGLVEHGAEQQVVQDVMRARNLKPGDPGWREAFDEVMDLRQNLEGSTVHGDEIVAEMDPSGVLRMGPAQIDLMRDY